MTAPSTENQVTYCALLRAAYKSYTPVPEGLWREIHQLYLEAERERVVAEIVDPETKEAVVNIYVEALLLALTDPYRLSPGEVDKVSAQIRSSRPRLRLRRANIRLTEDSESFKPFAT